MTDKPWEQPPVPGKPPGWGSNVQPRRRPRHRKPDEWECACRVNPHYLVNCLDCHTRRP